MTPRLLRAAKDVCLPPDHNVVFITTPPLRWDEYLDLDTPLLISSSCQGWGELSVELWRSGLSELRQLRLAESHGAVHPVSMGDASLLPAPSDDDWVLVVNWTHPEEGWRARLPLWSRSYVVTRQKEKGEHLVRQLVELGATAIATPTIEFEAPDSEQVIRSAVGSLDSFDWLIFTSPNGVHQFFSYLREGGRDHRALGKMKFACIGPGTAAALSREGFLADLLPDRFVAEGLLEALPADLSGQRMLLARAQEAREILPETLRNRGAELTVAPVYKTVLPPPPEGHQSVRAGSTRVLFTSSSTVKNWVRMTEDRSLPCFCIGPVTADTARGEGFEILGVARDHTIDGLLETIVEKDGLRPDLV